MRKIKMERLYNEKARYIAFGVPEKLGTHSGWTPGLKGGVFTQRTHSQQMASVAPGFLPRWLQNRLDEGLSLPDHFDVISSGRGSCAAEEVFSVEE